MSIYSIKRIKEFYKFNGDINIEHIKKELESLIKEKNLFDKFYLDDIDFYYFKIYETIEDAKKIIEELDNGDYHCLAVRYKEPIIKIFNKDKEKLAELEERKLKIESYIKNVEDLADITKLKSKYRTCSNCESKLCMEYIKNQYCPVCNFDMRAKVYKDKINNYEARIIEVDNKIDSILKRGIDSFGDQEYQVNWIIKVEYPIEYTDISKDIL